MVLRSMIQALVTWQWIVIFFCERWRLVSMFGEAALGPELYAGSTILFGSSCLTIHPILFCHLLSLRWLLLLSSFLLLYTVFIETLQPGN